jgi:plasmid stabilization system protein ParE
MNYTLLTTAAAVDDLVEIVDYLKDVAPLHADLFIDEYIQYTGFILQHPYLFAIVKDNIRKVRMQRHKYLIIYRIDDQQQQILITAVLHHSRHPRRWLR